MRRGGQDVPREGPRVLTPLSAALYTAYKASRFRSYEDLGAAAGMSRASAWAYCNGTRGGRDKNSAESIGALARVLGIDPDATIELAGPRVHADVQDVERVIRNLNWPREAQEELIAALREMDRTRRRR